MRDLFAWYPLNKVKGKCCLLAYALVDAEDGEVSDIQHVVDLMNGYPIDIDDWDEDQREQFEDELVATASSMSHDNWKGFECFWDAAFPRANKSTNEEREACARICDLMAEADRNAAEEIRRLEESDTPVFGSARMFRNWATEAARCASAIRTQCMTVTEKLRERLKEALGSNTKLEDQKP